MKPIVNIYKLGRLPYVKALSVQLAFFNHLINNLKPLQSIDGSCFKAYDATMGYEREKHFSINNNNLNTTNFITTNNNINTTTFNPNQARNSLLLVEHEPVYTIGLRSKDYNDDYFLNLKKKLHIHRLNADFVKTNRGGLITFHGPGQLVAYPIIYLGDFRNRIQNRSVRAYVNLLENIIIDTLMEVGLYDAHTVNEHPGVWVDGGNRKIAFIGISCKRFVTMHGISINCDCDLSWFDHIVSCGIEDKKITSISNEYSLLGSKENHNEINRHNYSSDNLLFQMSNKVSSDLSVVDGKKSYYQSSSMLEERKMDYKNLTLSVEQVANFFCQSFSKHFDCIMKEKDLKSIFPVIGKL